jgi:8-oxo-dGTP diphosphatase
MKLELSSFQAEPEKQPIVAVGGVIYRLRAGRPELLLIKKQQGFWTLPKGRVKPGESDQEALAREIREETGLDGQIETLVQQVRYTINKASRPRPKIVTYYIVRANEGDLRPNIGEGIQHVRWFPMRAALRRIRRPRIRAVARAARALLEAGSRDRG